MITITPPNHQVKIRSTWEKKWRITYYEGSLDSGCGRASCSSTVIWQVTERVFSDYREALDYSYDRATRARYLAEKFPHHALFV